MEKVLSQTGLTKLIQLSKDEFLPKSNVVTASTVTLANVATSGSYTDLINTPNNLVIHTASTAVGSGTQPVYIASDGTATATTYELNKTVPSDAVFTDTTYSVFTGATGSTAGASGLVPQPAATDNTKFLKGDGTWADVPTEIPSQTSQSGKFLTTNGTSVSWGTPSDTLNTAGSTDSSSKLFLIGATSQTASSQTYSQDTAFVDTNGRLNSAAPAADANDTTVATTKWVADKGYTNTTVTFRVWS